MKICYVLLYVVANSSTSLANLKYEERLSENRNFVLYYFFHMERLVQRFYSTQRFIDEHSHFHVVRVQTTNIYE